MTLPPGDWKDPFENIKDIVPNEQFSIEYDDGNIIATEILNEPNVYGASQVVAYDVPKWFGDAVVYLWERYDPW